MSCWVYIGQKKVSKQCNFHHVRIQWIYTVTYTYYSMAVLGTVQDLPHVLADSPSAHTFPVPWHSRCTHFAQPLNASTGQVTLLSCLHLFYDQFTPSLVFHTVVNISTESGPESSLIVAPAYSRLHLAERGYTTEK